jgi:hypothetical protein
MTQTIHNPDQYMSDLRQMLAQGRKRMGMLLGAGAPASIITPAGSPLIPVTAALTERVLASLKPKYGAVLDGLIADLQGKTNIEQILSRVRTLADALGENEVRKLNGKGYAEVSQAICKEIGKVVSVHLPEGSSPYSELAGWIGGTARDHAFEVFTPNYDLLMEQAFERAHIPYFDGFCGAHRAFFDAATIANGDLPPRWVRLWKLHGSLGWEEGDGEEIIRTGSMDATQLIYPTHLKYDQTQKLPYAALFDRLRKFLLMPDSLLMTSGFSFSDRHLSTLVDECLSANRATAVVAFQFGALAQSAEACRLAAHRANMSVYARDGAVINGIEAPWRPGELPHPAWAPIRGSFWQVEPPSPGGRFLLGDFGALARYVALTRAEHAMPDPNASIPAEK